MAGWYLPWSACLYSHWNSVVRKFPLRLFLIHPMDRTLRSVLYPIRDWCHLSILCIDLFLVPYQEWCCYFVPIPNTINDSQSGCCLGTNKDTVTIIDGHSLFYPNGRYISRFHHRLFAFDIPWGHQFGTLLFHGLFWLNEHIQKVLLMVCIGIHPFRNPNLFQRALCLDGNPSISGIYRSVGSEHPPYPPQSIPYVVKEKTKCLMLWHSGCIPNLRWYIFVFFNRRNLFEKIIEDYFVLFKFIVSL